LRSRGPRARLWATSLPPSRWWGQGLEGAATASGPDLFQTVNVLNYSYCTISDVFYQGSIWRFRKLICLDQGHVYSPATRIRLECSGIKSSCFPARTDIARKTKSLGLVKIPGPVQRLALCPLRLCGTVTLGARERPQARLEPGRVGESPPSWYTHCADISRRIAPRRDRG
jgi:hypothetical protein